MWRAIRMDCLKGSMDSEQKLGLKEYINLKLEIKREIRNEVLLITKLKYLQIL